MAPSPTPKRPRGATDGEDSRFLDLDATETIHEIDSKYGNSRLARGAFGELSIAIRVCNVDDDKSSWKLAVCKTIPQATTTVFSSGGVPVQWSKNDNGSSSKSKRMLDSSVYNEIMALRVLTPHPNIVPFHGLRLPSSSRSTLPMPGALSLVFDYCPCDLHMVLHHSSVLPIHICKRLVYDLLRALEHCHSHSILHRDVKPSNCLLSSRGQLQLCDFGLATVCPSGEASLPPISTTDMPGQTQGTKGLCTLWYRPPEVLLGASARESSVDMYSAACVVAEMLTGRALFQGKSALDQLALVFSLLGTPSDTNWPNASQQLPDYDKVKFVTKSPQDLCTAIPRLAEDGRLQELVQSMICLDPSKRISAKDALQSDWFLSSSKPPPASHATVAHCLIPSQLQEPMVLFSSPTANDTTLAVARTKALTLAESHRSFFIHNTDNTNKTKRRTLWEACQVLSNDWEIVCGPQARK